MIVKIFTPASSRHTLPLPLNVILSAPIVAFELSEISGEAFAMGIKQLSPLVGIPDGLQFAAALKFVPVPPFPLPTQVRVIPGGEFNGVSSVPQKIAQGENELTPLVIVTLPGEVRVAAFASVLIVRSEVHSDGDRGIGLVFRFVDVDNFYFFLMEQAGPYRRIGKKVAGTFADLDQPAVDLTQGYAPSTTFRLKVEARGDVLRAYLDEQLAVEGRDASLAAAGRVGLMTKGNDQASFGTFEVLAV